MNSPVDQRRIAEFRAVIVGFSQDPKTGLYTARVAMSFTEYDMATEKRTPATDYHIKESIDSIESTWSRFGLRVDVVQVDPFALEPHIHVDFVKVGALGGNKRGTYDPRSGIMTVEKTVGTFGRTVAHEFGHALGLADMYYSDENNNNHFTPFSGWLGNIMADGSEVWERDIRRVIELNS